MADVDFGMIYEAMLGGESECGDIGIIKSYENHLIFALVDVLGHGFEARKVALEAKNYLEDNFCDDVVDIINGLHKHLKGTRGAVAAICNLDTLTGDLSYAGIGNITVRIIGRKSIRIVPNDGVVGYMMSKPKKQNFKLNIGEIMLMHSDGIKEHFESYECEALLMESAQNIVNGILNKFGKKGDDASCIAVKYLSD